MASQEKPVERYLKAQVKKHGGYCKKLRVIGERGWPDRFVLFPFKPIYYIECKDEGKPLDPLQRIVHKLLWSLGQVCLRIDSKEKVDLFIFHATNSIPIPANSELARPA